LVTKNGDIKNYCVFCSASETVDAEYMAVAEQLGEHIARQQGTLVYGGGHVGLMGVLARAARQVGGSVVGVSIDAFETMGLSHAAVTELVVTRTMAERKQVMIDRADAFIALPGGLGTLDELTEVLTLKQLDFHRKPVVIINTQGVYDPLLTLFEQMIARKFARPTHRRLFYVAATAEDAMTYLQTYQPPDSIDEKWFVADE